MSAATAMRPRISIRTRRKLEHLRREALVYSAAVVAFALVMYLITSEVAHEAFAFGPP